MSLNLIEVSTLSDDEEEDGSSEDESSGSSDEDIESGGDDDDDEDEEESEDEVVGVESGGNVERNIHSSEDDPERECCPVCLNKFIGQDLGTPESCEHTFCFDCIKEWSKNINTCPIDRTEFNFIHLRAVPGGSTLKKVKVKVQPKEPEDAMQESVTLCEVCRNGDREDRLLLCDGCDLAYHCECLDPPLFYIPIEEWFCPPCSGVLQNGAVAGPSSSRRRVIPRTRASETVRSRVQNLRTGGSSTPRTTSGPRKSNTTKSTRKRKRRSYRRTYKKVVQLARTKKDMTNALKNKVGVRGSTVVVTYRRRRRKRRTTKRRFSRKSVASTRALPTPSTKQRIAKNLGLSKPQGSSVPQVKQSVGSRSGSRVSKLPSHSIFGNHNQLMDFDENFNEDASNMPSTSRSTSQRGSNHSSSPSTSGLNILDSIMAGQKLLHCKSDDITIKTDGTLILKDSSSSSKTMSNVKKIEPVQTTRTPMSVALVKTGVRSITSSANGKGASVSAGSSKPKDMTGSKASKPPKEKIVPETNSSSSQWTSKNNSSNTKSYSILMNTLKMSRAKEFYKKSSASLTTVHSKKQKTTSTKKLAADDNKTSDALIDEFQRDAPSDCESELSSKIETISSNKMVKKRVNSNLELESSSSNSIFSSFQSNKNVPDSSFSDDATNISIKTSKICIKKEVLSDEETNSGTICDNELVNNMYRKCSSEETKTDTSVESGDNKQQEVDINGICSRVKTEPVSSDSELDVKNVSLNMQNSANDKSSKYGTCKSEDSDCEASQSIIDTTMLSSSSIDFNSGVSLQRKIKEEVSSDTEDLSQSLVSTADPNFVSQSISPYPGKSKEENFCNEKTKTFFHSCTGDKLKKEVFRKNADTSVSSEFLSNSSKCVLPSRINCSENGNLPCTQEHSPEGINNSSDDDEDIPCTQAVSSPAVMEDTSDNNSSDDDDDDLPCTQGVFLSNERNNLSENCDLPCTQAVSVSRNTIYEDIDLSCTQVGTLNVARRNLIDDEELPCTQVVTPSVARRNLIDDEELPCTQVAPPSFARRNLIEDDELPCTQVVTPSVAKRNLIYDDKLPCTQVAHSSIVRRNLIDDEELPCTQVAPPSFARRNLIEDDELPCTQVVTPSVAKRNLIDDDDKLPCTQVAPSSIVRRNLIDDENKLPCTQVVTPRVSRRNLIDDDDDLPCTQAVSLSALDNNSSDDDDDLPCTQAVSLSLAKPDVLEDDSLPSTQVVSFPNSKPTSNIVSAHKSSLIGLSNTNRHSIDFIPKGLKDVNMCDEVQETQVNVFQRTKSKSLLNSCVDECSDDDIPPTQINFEFLKPADVSDKPVISRTSSRDSKLLPTKYLGRYKFSNKNTFSRDQPNIQGDLPPTQMFRGYPETIDLPTTQSNTVVNDESLFDLPATQISDVPSKMIGVPFKYGLKRTNLSPPQLMENNSSDLPVTEVFCDSSKERNMSKFPDKNINDGPFSLPATQVFNSTLKQTHLHRSNVDNDDSESFDLPPTQVNAFVSEAIKDLDSTVNEISKNVPTDESLKVSNANFEEVFSMSSEMSKKSSGKLMLSKNSSPDSEHEKTGNSNINNILSNIKHLVKSLSVKVPADSTCQVTENNENLLHKNQENALDNLSSKTVDSELSEKSTTNEDTLDGINDCKNLERKDIDLDENLPLEKLREIASKSPHVVPNKNVGIHKHLPQVIPKLPVKDHVKLKPSNRRTFSFEEVAKLEEPQKIHKNSSVDLIQNVSNCNTFENNASDDDDLPPTQKVDFVNIMSKPTGNKRNNSKSHSNTAEIKSHSVHQPELNSLKVAKTFRDSPCSSIDCTDDFPNTQLTTCQNKDVDSTKTLPLVGSSKSTVVSKAQACTNININKGARLSSYTDEASLSSTEIHVGSENILSKQMNTNEFLSVPGENNMPVNKQKTLRNKSSVNIISVKSRVTSKHKKSSTYDDMDDLPSTQVSNDILQKKPSNMSNKSIDKTANSKFCQNNSSKVGSDNACGKKSKTSEEQKIRESIQSKTKEPSSEYELDDLPATQVSENTRKAMKNLLHNNDIIGRNNLNDTFNLNKHVEKASSDKNNSFNLRKLSEATDTSNPTVQRQKNSVSDDVHNIKESDGNNTLQNSLSNLENKRSDHHKRSRKSCEPERNVVDVILKSDQNLSSASAKSNYQRAVHNSTVDKPVSDTFGKQLDFPFNNNNCTVAVKQEKIDHDFEVPLIEMQKSNLLDSSQAAYDIGRIRVKTENPSDSLPTAQVATFNQANNSAEGSSINNVLLASTSIKSEIYSDDDEITIIDAVKDASSKVKEEIVIDDEDNELTILHAVEKSQSVCFIKREKEVSAHTEINIASVKIEKISDNRERVMSKVVSDNTCRRTSETSEEQKIREFIQSKTKEPSSEYELDDLPATQVSENTRKAMKNLSHNDDIIGKNNLNDTFNLNKHVENVSSNKNNSSNLRSKIEKISDNSERVVPKIKHQGMKISKHNEKKDSKAASTTKEKEQRCDKDYANSNLTDKSHKPGAKRKISNDCLISKEEKKKAKKDSLQSKPETISHKHETNIKRSKSGVDDVRDKRSEKRPDYNSIKPKSSSSKNNPELSSMQLVQNRENLRLSTDKQRLKNFEKENNNVSPKNNGLKDVIITLKSSKKRPRESSETKSDLKRGKYNYLDSESCSSENSCNKINVSTNTNSNIKTKKNFDIMDDRVSSSTPNSDISMGNDNLQLSKTLQTRDVKKILSKQDLKEEIANEIKLVLKPFFVSGLISKEDYKDIMRRAVPKVFMNCHNSIHQEKIRKLVLSYVAMLSKS